MNTGAIIVAAVAGIGITVSAISGIYVVDEGRVAVVTNMGKAVRQEGPEGMKFKTPFVMGVREFDVRERALTGELSAATANQLVTSITFSVNWQPDPARVMEIYIKYGSPDEFAANTIRPRLQQSLKATVGKFTATDLTREREQVAAAMLREAQKVLGGYPAILSSVQIENFSLPERYMEAVLQKEEQREATQREQLSLEQQRIKSQQAVQTAEADRDAEKAKADGQAYATRTSAAAEAEAIRIKAEAEADGIKAVQQAISGNPLLIEYERVKAWDGQLPATVIGDAPDLLMQAPQR